MKKTHFPSSLTRGFAPPPWLSTPGRGYDLSLLSRPEAILLLDQLPPGPLLEHPLAPAKQKRCHRSTRCSPLSVLSVHNFEAITELLVLNVPSVFTTLTPGLDCDHAV